MYRDAWYMLYIEQNEQTTTQPKKRIFLITTLIKQNYNRIKTVLSTF